MNPPRVLLEDLIAQLGAPTCEAYVVAIRGRSDEWLQARGIDPESVLIRNLETRSIEPADDATASSRLYVSEDGCGNNYFVNASDAEPLVFLDSHDPPGIEETGLTLSSFLSSQVAVRSVRHASKRADRLTICKTDLPHRSILDPISLREWSEVASRHPAIELRGYRLGRNPFTREEMRFESPGLAVIRWNRREVVAVLHCGSLLLEGTSPNFRPFAEKLAEDLDAHVV